jgi:hypothetical protein
MRVAPFRTSVRAADSELSCVTMKFQFDPFEGESDPRGCQNTKILWSASQGSYPVKTLVYGEKSGNFQKMRLAKQGADSR